MTLRATAPILIPPSPFPLGGKDLQIDLIYQEQSQWCWAACMEMVFRKNGVPTPTPTRCAIANAAFDLQGCCSSPSSSLCNKPCPVTSIALEWQRWGYNSFYNSSAIAFNAIIFEIDEPNLRPIEVGIKWGGGGGHAILITGYDYQNGVEYVTINDPTYGKSQVEYQALLSRYNGTGSWKFAWTGIRKG